MISFRKPAASLPLTAAAEVRIFVVSHSRLGTHAQSAGLLARGRITAELDKHTMRLRHALIWAGPAELLPVLRAGPGTGQGLGRMTSR